MSDTQNERVSDKAVQMLLNAVVSRSKEVGISDPALAECLRELQQRRKADRALIAVYQKKNTGGVELAEIFKAIENLLP